MKADYIITFKWGFNRHRIRIDAAESESGAVVTATVRARLKGIPVNEAEVKIRPAAYQKKSTIAQNKEAGLTNE